MQTFLPYSDFSECAKVLDRARLGKQRVECNQILTTIGKKQGWLPNDKPKIAWANHPAVLMWEDYVPCLVEYARAITKEWTARGYVDNTHKQREYLLSEWEKWKGYRIADSYELKRPVWLNLNKAKRIWLTDSHKAMLLRKNKEHYFMSLSMNEETYQWLLKNYRDYYWPVTLHSKSDAVKA